MTLAVEVWQRDQITTPGIPTLVETITEGWGRTFRNVKNDYGVAAINVQLSDTDAITAAQPGRLLKFVRDGTVRGGGVIGPRRYDMVKRGEEAEQVLVLQCAGFLSVLNDARVPPYNGAGWSPWDRTRAWDWSNPALDVSGWSAATELWRQGDPADLSASTFIEIVRDQGRFAFGSPEGFADADAMWIWSSTYDGTGGTGGSGTLRMDPGISYFHKTFTVADDTHARVIGAADDFLEVAIDGVKLFATAPSPEEAWSRAQQRDVFLTAGTHTVRVKCENYTRAFSNGNIAALVLAVHEVNPVNGSLTSVLVHTDDTWVALDYPADPPGFTATDILLTLLAEVQALGSLLDVDPTYTATLGTATESMPVLSEITCTVNDKFGEFVRQLAAAWIDTRMNHDMTWDVWDKGTPGSASGVTYAPGVNITELELDGDTTPVSFLRVLCRDGYRELGDDSTGRQEAVDYSDLSETEALSRGTEALAEMSSARWRVILAVQPVGSDVPFEDVDIFDTATVPDPDGSPVSTECVATSYTEDENGEEILVAEFGDLVLSPEEKRAADLARLSVGGLSGSKLAVTPGGVSPSPSPLSQGGGSFGQVATGQPLKWTRTATDTTTTSLLDAVVFSGTISEFIVKFDVAQAGAVDVVLELNGTPVTGGTLTIAAGEQLGHASGLGVALAKYTDELTITCTDVGFGFVATVLVS